jgi:hypothetical protein
LGNLAWEAGLSRLPDWIVRTGAPLVKPILLCDHLIELTIFLPSPGDIAEIAQAESCLAKARALVRWRSR